MSNAAPSSAETGLMAQLLRHGMDRPGDVALVCGPHRMTWGALRHDVLAAAAAIRARCGDAPGRVALLGASGLPLVTGYLAVIAAGGCAVPLPVSAHPDALAGMIANCVPSLILADTASAGLLAPELAARTVLLDATALQLPAVLRGHPPENAPQPVDPEADFNIIYSSGTTGQPKGIVHSHAMRQRQATRGLFGLDAGSTMLLATPLYSNTTLMPLLATLYHGGRVILMAKFDAAGYLDLAEAERASHTMLVPVQYQRLLAVPGFDTRDLSGFKVKQCTGAPLSAALKRGIAARWPGKFYEIYGLTEGGCTCILDAAAHPDKAHTVGRPAPGNEIRVIDENGADVPPGQPGEIVGRSEMMMSGYFRNPEATQGFYWRDAAGVLFHRTGDIGRFDEDGFLILLDRKKDVIISGGFNIYASDIEEKLLEHPAVAEVAVIAVPSARWGETPLALVVPQPGLAPDPAALMFWVNARLGRMQHVSAVVLRTSLPRNTLGKVTKAELRNAYREERP
jgi:long-chain acyl-CoA synthetase